MVHGDFIDTYYNNTLKFKMALQYIANYCNQTQYVLIIDGDYYLNVNRSVLTTDFQNLWYLLNNFSDSIVIDRVEHLCVFIFYG